MRKQKKVDKKTREAIKQLYLDCALDMDKVAKQFHLDTFDVIKILKDYGVQGPGL